MRERAELNQANLEEDAWSLGSSKLTAALEDQREHRAQVARLKARRLGGVPLPIGGRRLDQSREGRIDRKKEKLTEVVREVRRIARERGVLRD